MNKIIYKNNYILFELNNGDKKAFLAGTIRHYVNGSSLSFYLLDNEVGEMPVINVNYHQTTVNGIQITEDNIDNIFEDIYNYDIFKIIDFSLIGDVLDLVTSDGKYDVDLTKYNYDAIIDIINNKIIDNSNNINEVDNKLDIEITRSTDKDVYLESKINSEVIRSTNTDNELLNNINLVDNKISSEIVRSTNKDTEIVTNLSNEIDRAKTAESGLTTSINLIHTSLSNEIIRSTNKDTEIETNLSNEIIRAKESEAELDEKFDEYYKKDEIDNKLEYKADKADVYTKVEVDSKLGNKVDKEAGKGLSSNDYTSAEKTKLASLHNYDDTAIIKSISDEVARATAAESVLDSKKANKSDVYTKGESDNLLLNKADKSNTYTKGEVDNKLEYKADKDEVYTKDEVDTKLAVKVDKEAGKGLSSNDYTTAEKTKLASLNNYNDSGITKSINDEITRATAAESALEAKKANKTDVYTKGEVDNKISTISSAITSDLKEYYKKLEVDTKLAVKVDKEAGKGLSSNDYTTTDKAKLASLNNYDDSTIRGLINTKQNTLVSGTSIKTINGNSILGSGNIVIEGGSIIDAYTKIETDNLLSNKSDKSSTYTKVETDNKISAATSAITSDLMNYYKKSEVDTKLTTKVDKVTGKMLTSNDYTITDKNKVSSLPNIVQKTQAEYDAITSKDNNTLYIIIG